MERSIKHQYFFAHTPEKVWQYLTNSDLMELWLMKNNFQPVVGTDFQFRINPIESLNFDGIFYCTVLEIEPFKKLSYSWKAGPGEGKITLDSVVIWKLEPTAEGTNVFLEHNGFAKEENLGFFDGFNHGWVEKFEKIANLINA
ncbi:SRPBCC family protein [Flavobacterium sp. N1736]|uniref:SRPBCC family protein n=1 Tax=Flavobacterium sp. N1736 TaxID=2986823 RepID=UPI0022248661|nr:SRPBCC domain-containing protein [Flavobacterium sp. N1736]